MKFTITLQRKTGANVFESMMVLVTEDYGYYCESVINLRKLFIQSNTYLAASEHKGEDVTRGFIEYDLSKGE